MAVVARLPPPQHLAAVFERDVVVALKQLESRHRPQALHLRPEQLQLAKHGRCLGRAHAGGPPLAPAGVDLAHDGTRDGAAGVVDGGIVEQHVAELEAAPPLAALPQDVAQAGLADRHRSR